MLISPIGASSPQPRPATETANAVPATAPAAVVDNKEVERAVKAANRVLESSASGIEFSVDRSSGKTVDRITDKQTRQVIRQIPSVEMLEIARAIDRLQGTLLDQVG